ncbi:MAG: ATP-binding protein [Pseudomonadota bacterium]
MPSLLAPLSQRSSGSARAASLLFAFCVSFAWSVRAHAQAAGTGPVTCEAVEQRLSRAQADLESLTRERDALRNQAADTALTQAELAQANEALEENSRVVVACQAQQKNLCAAAEVFAHGLSAGHVEAGGLAQCINPDDRRALVEELSGWSNVGAMLAQLGAFASGDSDAAPGLGPVSGSKLEKILARLFAQGNGTPLLYRRLLVEAMRGVAPHSWAEIKLRPGVVRWFASNQELDESVIAEVRASATSTPSAGDPLDLSASLALVSAYQVLAKCAGPAPANDCRRADQVRRMLESNGPVVARRRVQDIWATPCSGITEGVTKEWLRDVPPARASQTQADEVAKAIEGKLFTCYLRDSTIEQGFAPWLSNKLPAPDLLTARTLDSLSKLEGARLAGSPADLCAHAARSLQRLPMPSECSLPSASLAPLERWMERQSGVPAESFGLGVCARLVRTLWEGHGATLPNSYPTPPALEDAVQLLQQAPLSAMAELRGTCDRRLGRPPQFALSLRQLAALAKQFGENSALSPWKLDPETLEPTEKQVAMRAAEVGPWFDDLLKRQGPCSLLGFDETRCRECRSPSGASVYDCALLHDVERSWLHRTRQLIWSGALGLALAWLLIWAERLRRAVRRYGDWRARAAASFERIQLPVEAHPLRYLLPSRWGHFEIALPDSPNWLRWGSRAVVVRADGSFLQERDVNRAGFTARSLNTALALVVHDDLAAPDLGAVRAVLEWDARAGSRAVHVLPISWSRLNWARNAADLLELAEDSSLRGNPFELRGRITSSSQFFNRERLVSGLLAGAQAGRFVVVTGLRRFGKSSLALEVARRLPGPSAYVDLAGFHHEIRFSRDPADAADAILRFLCLKLLESAKQRAPKAELELAAPNGAMGAATLTTWFRDFAQAVVLADSGKIAPVLLILDEIEQAIGAAAQLNHALDVFAILVGRLRISLPGASASGAAPIGVLLCSALHPLLWSPLATLAHQSLIGSFENVSVPCLPEETARAMMQGLGARHGIRFSEQALLVLVQESQSVPLLLRRLGSAVLELYDPDRARQGALGAVEIGIEGVNAAVEREVSEGSPLRVWIESEIAEAGTPTGDVLRFLANHESAKVGELRTVAASAFRKQFELTGVALALPTAEAARRAEEGAGVVLRILGDSGLLRAHGDPTEPEAYALPDGVIRRILSAESVDYKPAIEHEASLY